MKYYYRTRDRPSHPVTSTIPDERREKLKSTMRKIIAVMLIAIVILLAACAPLGTPIKAAEIDGNVELDGYGEYISNDELGKLCPTVDISPKRSMLSNLQTIQSAQATIRALPVVMIPTDIKSLSDVRWQVSM